MTLQAFEKILLQPESTTLDFKKLQYDFSNDNDNSKTAQFVKDIISLCNTIRTDSAFIVLGVEIKPDGSKVLVGINEHIDDSILQEKVKNKTFPVPIFSYQTLDYSGLHFGIIEVPVRRYECPITVTIKLRGLEPGKFYFRRGSSNAEANGLESININKWFESLPERTNQLSLLDEVSKIITQTTEKNLPLSQCISVALKLAIKFDLRELKQFCANELSGWTISPTQEEIASKLSYRTNEIVFTPGKLNTQVFGNWDARRVIQEIKKIENVYETKMFFPQSIVAIEEALDKLSQSEKILLHIEQPATNFIDDPKFRNITMTIYMNKDNFDNIYMNIRQKLVDKLMGIF